MDIHNLPEGTTPEDIAKAHAKDMETQRKYGVEYTKYWMNEGGRKGLLPLPCAKRGSGRMCTS